MRDEQSSIPRPLMSDVKKVDLGILAVEAHEPGVQISLPSSSVTEYSSSEKTGDSDKNFYVEFEPGSLENPATFSHRQKWAITLMASYYTLLSSSTSGSYNLGFESMIPALGCTQSQADIGLSVYALGFGVVPLVSSSLSEEFGRQPLYIGSGVGFMLMYIGIALSKNIQTVIVLRFIQGAFGSTGATMVGGTIADIWMPHERGLPMSIFAFAAVGGTGLGPVIAGWVAMNPHLQWKWIQWIHAILCALFLVTAPFVMQETRSSILLMRKARSIRKSTGDGRYKARVEEQRKSLRHLIFISCTRPIYLLLTEPIVISFSLWIGLAWGVTYALIESIPNVFRTLHDFNIGQIGTTFMGMVIGSIFGFVTNMYQEKLYQNNFNKRGPEARLYAACFAAVLLPIGIFVYSWASFRSVPWIVLIFGITLFMWATFIMYLGVFTYLADCYGPYASSALAGQSLFRNIMGAVFPLFTSRLFAALSYHWGGTVFACLAVAMMPIPLLLLLYGPAIRKRSQFSTMVSNITN